MKKNQAAMKKDLQLLTFVTMYILRVRHGGENNISLSPNLVQQLDNEGKPEKKDVFNY